MEARNCRSDRRETGTQIGQIGKSENRIGYQIRKPVSIFQECNSLIKGLNGVGLRYTTYQLR